jgi:hypothetical protein
MQKNHNKPVIKDAKNSTESPKQERKPRITNAIFKRQLESLTKRSKKLEAELVFTKQKMQAIKQVIDLSASKPSDTLSFSGF